MSQKMIIFAYTIKQIKIMIDILPRLKHVEFLDTNATALKH